jgi:tetratricopeptide (TPR) repeat protein
VWIAMLAFVLIAVGCRSPDGHIERGRALLEDGDFEAAMRHFDKAVDKAPERGDTWTWRARARLSAGTAEGVVDDLRRAVEVDAEAADAWRLLGEHALEPEERVAALDQSLARIPDDPPARLIRGRDRLVLGDGVGAAEDLAAWLAVHPEDKESHTLRGDALLLADRPYEALSAFEAGTASATHAPRAIHALQVRSRDGDREARRFLLARDEPPEPYLDLARKLYPQGQLQLALDAARRAVVVHRNPSPDRAFALSFGAAARAHMAMDPAFALRAVGRATERERVLKDALAECEKALAIHPVALCHQTSGFAWEQLDRPGKAVEAYGEALALDAEDHVSRWGRARAAAARKRWKTVIGDVDALRTAEQATVEALVLQAHARTQLPDGSPEEGLADLDAAVDLAHTTGTITDLFTAYKARGMFYAGLGETEQAVEDLSRARAVRPSLADPEVESTLAGLGGPR